MATTLTGVLLIVTALELAAVVWGIQRRGLLGGDLTVVQAVSQRFLDTGVLYSPSQFEGPYTNVDPWLPKGVAFLYPPPAILLFVPFLFLPAVLWWVIPLGIVVAGIWYWRPVWWTWPIMAGALVPMGFSAGVTFGNTVMWVMAALTLATRWPAFAALLVLKPTMLMFALPFIRRRSLWLGFAVMALVSLPFLPYWFEWIEAIGNLESDGILYNWQAYPVTLIPLVAWLGRRPRE